MERKKTSAMTLYVVLSRNRCHEQKFQNLVAHFLVGGIYFCPSALLRTPSFLVALKLVERYALRGVAVFPFMLTGVKGGRGYSGSDSMAHPPSRSGEFLGVWGNRKHSTEPADEKR